MAITIRELFRGRRAGGNLREYTYVRNFFAESTSSVTPEEVVADPAVPIFGAAYPTDSLAFVKNINCTAREEHPLFFDLEVEYSNVLDFAPGQGLDPAGTTSPTPGAGDPLAAQDSPLKRPWVIKWGTQTITRSVLEDVDGAPVKNAAGALIDGGLEIEHGYLTCTVTRNELAATFDPVLMATYVWRTNLNTWNRWAPERALLASIETGDRQYDRGVFFFPVTYQFRFETRTDRTWRRKVLNAGWWYLKVAGSGSGVANRDYFKDAWGKQLSIPGYLKADGTEAVIGVDTPNYLEFKVYETIDFKGLNMGK